MSLWTEISRSMSDALPILSSTKSVFMEFWHIRWRAFFFSPHLFGYPWQFHVSTTWKSKLCCPNVFQLDAVIPLCRVKANAHPTMFGFVVSKLVASLNIHTLIIRIVDLWRNWKISRSKSTPLLMEICFCFGLAERTAIHIRKSETFSMLIIDIWTIHKTFLKWCAVNLQRDFDNPRAHFRVEKRAIRFWGYFPSPFLQKKVSGNFPVNPEKNHL